MVTVLLQTSLDSSCKITSQLPRYLPKQQVKLEEKERIEEQKYQEPKRNRKEQAKKQNPPELAATVTRQRSLQVLRRQGHHN